MFWTTILNSPSHQARHYWPTAIILFSTNTDWMTVGNILDSEIKEETLLDRSKILSNQNWSDFFCSMSVRPYWDAALNFILEPYPGTQLHLFILPYFIYFPPFLQWTQRNIYDPHSQFYPHNSFIAKWSLNLSLLLAKIVFLQLREKKCKQACTSLTTGFSQTASTRHHGFQAGMTRASLYRYCTNSSPKCMKFCA